MKALLRKAAERTAEGTPIGWRGGFARLTGETLTEALRQGASPGRAELPDCFSHALALASGEPLLVKGSDFSRHDATRVA